MPKTQYYTATTVDGFIADPNDSLDWLFEVPRDGGSGYDAFREFFADVGAMAMGATTYEWVLGHEQLVDHPEKWATWYGKTPCWVFTHRQLPVLSRTWTSGSSRATCARCTRRWSRRRARRTCGSSAAASSSARSPTTGSWTRSGSACSRCSSARARRSSRACSRSKRVTLESARKDGQQVLLVYSVSAP